MRQVGWRAAVALGCFAICLGVGVGATAGQRRGRALRSLVVYPPQRVALRMDHSLPQHRRLRCERCHEGATRSERSADLLVPREEACNPCHADATRAAGGDCAFCHVGAEEGRVPASSFPPPRLTFSHAVHAREGVGCVACHDVEEATVATRSHLPTMRSCFRCHGEAGPSPLACGACHERRPDGRLRTTFGEGRMLPPRWLEGMDHDRDFLVRHRWVAADRGALCAECHTERECVACHDGRGNVRRVHRGDFLTTHAAMAQRDVPRCASCHTTQRFCTECHARLGLATVSSPAAAAGRRFHPPSWVDAHGHEARRSMTQCSSCHVERDCVACHGAAGRSAGVSPHPPGFVGRCAGDLARNPRACVTCHGPDVARLRARCR